MKNEEISVQIAKLQVRVSHLEMGAVRIRTLLTTLAFMALTPVIAYIAQSL